MVEILIFIVISYGASNIMVFGTIFEKWRVFWKVDDENTSNFFSKLFGCMMCLPFWWGVIISLLLYSPSSVLELNPLISEYMILSKVIYVFFDGCFSSGGVWLIHTLQEKLEERLNQ